MSVLRNTLVIAFVAGSGQAFGPALAQEAPTTPTVAAPAAVLTYSNRWRLEAAIDKKIYKVEIDDEEDVLVKRRKGPDFAVELVESTVEGTRVNHDKE